MDRLKCEFQDINGNFNDNTPMNIEDGLLLRNATYQTGDVAVLLETLRQIIGSLRTKVITGHIESLDSVVLL